MLLLTLTTLMTSVLLVAIYFVEAGVDVVRRARAQGPEEIFDDALEHTFNIRYAKLRTLITQKNSLYRTNHNTFLIAQYR